MSSSSSSSSPQAPKTRIKRPRNSWLVFRVARWNVWKKANLKPVLPQPIVSKIISLEWQSMSDDEKLHYKREADKLAAEHQLNHPGYSYKPRRDANAKKRKATVDEENVAPDGKVGKSKAKSNGKKQKAAMLEKIVASTSVFQKAIETRVREVDESVAQAGPSSEARTPIGNQPRATASASDGGDAPITQRTSPITDKPQSGTEQRVVSRGKKPLTTSTRFEPQLSGETTSSERPSTESTQHPIEFSFVFEHCSVDTGVHQRSNQPKAIVARPTPRYPTNYSKQSSTPQTASLNAFDTTQEIPLISGGQRIDETSSQLQHEFTYYQLTPTATAYVQQQRSVSQPTVSTTIPSRPKAPLPFARAASAPSRVTVDNASTFSAVGTGVQPQNPATLTSYGDNTRLQALQQYGHDTSPLLAEQASIGQGAPSAGYLEAQGAVGGTGAYSAAFDSNSASVSTGVQQSQPGVAYTDNFNLTQAVPQQQLNVDQYYGTNDYGEQYRIQSAPQPIQPIHDEASTSGVTLNSQIQTPILDPAYPNSIGFVQPQDSVTDTSYSNSTPQIHSQQRIKNPELVAPLQPIGSSFNLNYAGFSTDEQPYINHYSMHPMGLGYNHCAYQPLSQYAEDSNGFQVPAAQPGNYNTFTASGGTTTSTTNTQNPMHGFTHEDFSLFQTATEYYSNLGEELNEDRLDDFLWKNC
ncbi:hypothetical protein CC1G_07858 [Coprinopsis cinerea okayama7|uniref:HMG box domain-containing protein n=1 Tax=Coprinopsis cinerea (strain Okayama-7 / 130 / ATCC MYA-4618 / FGSC 9003) TaxID=240176 RepID=A8P431_COPC7|nr:hypothetical protein CC1G_07858 [Coprinopsis cinerea okayama7\|eukprot:XP_001838667.1 hypothetical protein CC1G_07858 [Coprinopsis cinerea okayama7\